MSDETELHVIMKRLRRNISVGKKARKALGAKLAEMPAAQAAKLPRALLARLAPDAMAVLAQAAAGTRGIAPVESTDPVEAEPRDADDQLPPLWFTALLWVLLVIQVALIAGLLERPIRWAVVYTGLASPDSVGLCARLDRWTDQCSYAVGSSGLTLEDIASRLAIPVEQLATINPQSPPSQALPYHALIRIDRAPRRP